MTTYNVRVARSENIDGPFLDFFGAEVRDTTNNFPILTAPYKFENHPGWAGTAHCGVLRNDDGRYFMFHQSRLSPQNHLMVLHTREMFFTESGWPVVSPQRYAATEQRIIRKNDLVGEWEIIRVEEPAYERNLEAGQILWGEGELRHNELNTSLIFSLNENNKLDDKGTWQYDGQKQLLNFSINNENINNLIVYYGHDWENEMETIVFTGLDERGRSVWGKRIK